MAALLSISELVKNFTLFGDEKGQILNGRIRPRLSPDQDLD
jgi:hypothetical protein